MIRKALHGTAWFLVAFVVMSIALPVIDDIRKEYETSVSVYEKPWTVRWVAVDNGVIVSGVTRKRVNCNVVPHSTIVISAGWTDADGTHVRAFPAIRPNGKTEDAEPLVDAGEEFIIGPWLLRDDPDIVQRLDFASVKLTCRFPSGTTRLATIGPIRKADAQ